MPSVVPPVEELNAAAHWRTIDFISDLHLQAGEPATLQAWQAYLTRTTADAVFILGDLFEVWVGDDSALAADAESDFEQRCAAILQLASHRCALHFMHGNRDFLLGPAYAASAGFRLLADPTALSFGGQRWLLTHGDALCLGDTDYQRFRAQVRQDTWRRDFLARPLHERRRIAHELRQQSEARKRETRFYADVDTDMARAWLHAAGAQHMIHGHTHQPASHPLTEDAMRHVLSDWDATARPARAEVLRLSLVGTCVNVQLERLPAQAAG